MPDDPKQDSSGQPDSGDAVNRFVESRLTEEHLDNVWDRLQGTRTRGGGRVQKYGALDFLCDLWITLRVTGSLFKVAGGGALAAAVVLFLVIAGGEIVIHTPMNWQSASGQRLPETLRFRMAKAAARLEGPPVRFTGRLGGPLRGAGALTTRDASFSGRLPDGTPFTFTGALVLTNAPGVVDVRRRRDFIGAALIGELKLGTNPPAPFQQPYLP